MNADLTPCGPISRPRGNSHPDGRRQHLPLLFAGTELVEFSPTGLLAESMAVIGKNLQAREA
ncbi:MAG: hypothetical protein WBF34_31400 [Streptosporangiaceae bacterium]